MSYAYMMGMVSFATCWGRASTFALPNPLHFGLEFGVAAVIGFCLMGFVSAVETVGDVSGITKGGAGREATDKEITGATYADGLGTALCRCVWRAAKHIVQPERGLDRDDGSDELATL